MERRWAALLMRTGPDKARQDILWNMAGSFCYAFASMVLSFLVMRLAGEDQGGIFAFGYSTFGQQMFILAYFGIRPFQITDRAGDYRFGLPPPQVCHLRRRCCCRAFVSSFCRVYAGEIGGDLSAGVLQDRGWVCRCV